MVILHGERWVWASNFQAWYGPGQKKMSPAEMNQALRDVEKERRRRFWFGPRPHWYFDL